MTLRLSPTLSVYLQVEVWVHMADPLGAILDSKPYLAPLITPFEAVLALSGGSLSERPHELGLAPLLDWRPALGDEPEVNLCK